MSDSSSSLDQNNDAWGSELDLGTIWNSLQSRTRSSETYATFRNRLKTELFQKSYDIWHCSAIAAPLIRMRLTVFGRVTSFILD